jgi:D-lactate dehydrogenase (cytochrome)
MSAINNAGILNRPYPVKDTLFFKIQGAQEAVQLTSEVVKKVTKKHGSNRFEFAATDEEAADLWQTRKYALMSAMTVVPGARCWTTDVWYVHGNDITGCSVLIYLPVYLLPVSPSLCMKPRRTWQDLVSSQP